MSDGSVGALSSTGSGIVGRGELFRISSTHSTPRATPHVPSPDVVRIYVPYSTPSPTPTSSPQNGDIPKPIEENELTQVGPGGEVPKSLPIPLIQQDENKIRIKIDPTQDDLKTPVVEYGHFVVQPLGSEINSPF